MVFGGDVEVTNVAIVECRHRASAMVDGCIVPSERIIGLFASYIMLNLPGGLPCNHDAADLIGKHGPDTA